MHRNSNDNLYFIMSLLLTLCNVVRSCTSINKSRNDLQEKYNVLYIVYEMGKSIVIE